MTRGRRALSAEQQGKLRYVAAADDAWRRAKKYEYEKARRQAEERIAQFAATRDRAVYDAVESGVPKSVVGRDGLGTTNPHAVNEAYNRMVELQTETGVELPKPERARFSWGTILASDDRWLYAWVLDTQIDISTNLLVGDLLARPGFAVVVDKLNGVVTSISTPDGVLTQADDGWEDVREWAAAHAMEARGGN